MSPHCHQSHQIFTKSSGAGPMYGVTTPRRSDRRAAGFTLLELLVVIVIIGLLAAYVGPKYFSQLGKSEVTIAKAQIEAFEKSLDTYRLDVGRYPTNEEGLAALLAAQASGAG